MVVRAETFQRVGLLTGSTVPEQAHQAFPKTADVLTQKRLTRPGSNRTGAAAPLLHRGPGNNLRWSPCSMKLECRIRVQCSHGNRRYGQRATVGSLP